MEPEELKQIINNGEDSHHAFKTNITKGITLAREIIAFGNKQGGKIFIGVNDKGEIEGLTQDDVRRLNQLVPNTITNHIRPPIIVDTQNLNFENGLVMVVSVPEGSNKPYMDNNSSIYIRNGASTQKLQTREEIQLIFQTDGLVHADCIQVKGSKIADINTEIFESFFVREFGDKLSGQDISFPQILENMKLAKKGEMNYSGILLFGSYPQRWLPVFNVKAVSFPGIALEDENYLDSKDLEGRLSDIFQKVISFLLTNIRNIQNGQSFNSIGEPEIPRIVFEELVANALIHRDYFVSAPVKVFVFANRIEITSPGHLPNNLTTDNIKMGISNVRNPILHSFATKLLPYRGLGGGIKRALRAYPKIEFLDDREGNVFRVTIHRSTNL